MNIGVDFWQIAFVVITPPPPKLNLKPNDHEELMDCYTPGIILGEVVRKYEKEELRELLNQKIVEFIDQKGRDVVRDILRAEIIQQKEKVMKKVATLLC